MSEIPATYDLHQSSERILRGLCEDREARVRDLEEEIRRLRGHLLRLGLDLHNARTELRARRREEGNG